MKIITIIAAVAVLVFSSVTFAAPVNINTAVASEIAEALNGVGIKKAKAIIAYRKANGAFTSADQIVQVKGIGEATFDKNKADILIK